MPGRNIQASTPWPVPRTKHRLRFSQCYTQVKAHEGWTGTWQTSDKAGTGGKGETQGGGQDGRARGVSMPLDSVVCICAATLSLEVHLAEGPLLPVTRCALV
jgi:hypothetical protein